MFYKTLHSVSQKGDVNTQIYMNPGQFVPTLELL